MTPAIDTFTSPATDAGNGLHEGYVEVADVRLRYVDAGDRPLVVLLHGFPEFWYGWPSARRAVPPGAGGSIPADRAALRYATGSVSRKPTPPTSSRHAMPSTATRSGRQSRRREMPAKKSTAAMKTVARMYRSSLLFALVPSS
jgi:hypothetical protein